MMFKIFAALTFALGILFINSISSNYFDKIDPNVEYAASLSSRIQKLPLDNDYVFIGDSRTHQGMRPDTFAQEYRRLTGQTVRAVNLGRPGMQTPFMLFSLQNYLESTSRKPEAVIVNVSYYLLGGQDWMDKIYLRGFTPTYDQTAMAIRNSYLSVTEAVFWHLRSRIPLWRYRGTFHNVVVPALAHGGEAFAKALDQHRFLEYTTYDPILRGYSPRGASFIGEGTRSVGTAFRAGRDEERFLHAFEMLLALADQHGVRVYVYEFPWPPSHDTEMDRNLISLYRGILEERAVGYSGVTFVTYDHYFPYKHFIDPLHVNDPGAVQLSRLAAGWVAEDGLQTPAP